MRTIESLLAMDHRELAVLALRQAEHLGSVQADVADLRAKLHRRRQEVGWLRAQLGLPVDEACGRALLSDEPKPSRTSGAAKDRRRRASAS